MVTMLLTHLGTVIMAKGMLVIMRVVVTVPMIMGVSMTVVMRV